MGRTAKSAASVATVEKSTVATENAVENMNDTVKEEKETKKSTKPLLDTDEIVVISMLPNVSYKDSKTGDFYEWEEVNHEERMTFETLKNMWRNHKSYFKNMWLKPMDERVVNHFGLTSTFSKFEYLMDEKNYKRQNIDELCKNIAETPNGMKYSICNKIKAMVASGDLSDFMIIKALEKHLKLDLTSFLN